MTADFKSHVLLRDEKGFGGIPFKRLLLGAVGGGLTYSLLRVTLPGMALPVGAIMGLAFVLLTALNGGLPLWQRLLFRLRGSLLLHAAAYPTGLLSELARGIELPLDLARLEGEIMFAPPVALIDLDLREWVTFARPRESDRGDGLVFVDAPLAKETQ